MSTDTNIADQPDEAGRLKTYEEICADKESMGERIVSLKKELKQARDAFDSLYATEHRRHAALSEAVAILRRCRATCSPARLEEIDAFLSTHDRQG